MCAVGLGEGLDWERAPNKKMFCSVRPLQRQYLSSATRVSAMLDFVSNHAHGGEGLFFFYL